MCDVRKLLEKILVSVLRDKRCFRVVALSDVNAKDS